MANIGRPIKIIKQIITIFKVLFTWRVERQKQHKNKEVYECQLTSKQWKAIPALRLGILLSTKIGLLGGRTYFLRYILMCAAAYFLSLTNSRPANSGGRGTTGCDRTKYPPGLSFSVILAQKSYCGFGYGGSAKIIS